MQLSTENANNYKSTFDKGAKLIKGSIYLDREELGSAGFFEKRRLRKALTHFMAASSIEPTNGAPMLFIAKIEERLGNSERGLEWLKKANSVEPDNLILAIETGAALGRLGKHKEAATVLEGAARNFPDESRIQSNLGLSYLIGGETENAVKAFEILLRLEPDYPTNRKLLNLALEVQAGRRPTPKSEADVANWI